MAQLDALLCLPLAKKLDLRTELGDVLGKSLNGSHFVCLEGRKGGADGTLKGRTGCFRRRARGLLAYTHNGPKWRLWSRETDLQDGTFRATIQSRMDSLFGLMVSSSSIHVSQRRNTGDDSLERLDCGEVYKWFTLLVINTAILFSKLHHI